VRLLDHDASQALVQIREHDLSYYGIAVLSLADSTAMP
jgi:hypothetical protein